MNSQKQASDGLAPDEYWMGYVVLGEFSGNKGQAWPTSVFRTLPRAEEHVKLLRRVGGPNMQYTIKEVRVEK